MALEYTAEIVSGVATGLLVAPLVAVVDQSIVSNASGRETLPACLRRLGTQLFTSPGTFVRLPVFRWVVGVYGTTYAVANTTESYLRRAQFSTQHAANIKVAVTTIANVSLSATKDRAFTRMFASTAAHATRTVPVASLALYAARDTMSIAASFTAPDIIAPWLSECSGMSQSTAVNTSLLFMPLFAQVLNTPLYVLGLDLFNNPGQKAGRGTRLAALYTPTLLARWARILPAFGIGGVANRYIRLNLVPGRERSPVISRS
jgi:hypothetical protein